MTDHFSILCMKNGICRILTVLAILLSAAGCRNSGNSSCGETADGENLLPDWALGGFVRPQDTNPVISPDPDVKFDCPMRKSRIGWMESDTFNPAATVKDGKICVLFRAEDNLAQGIGKPFPGRRQHEGIRMDGRLRRSPDSHDGRRDLRHDVHVLEQKSPASVRGHIHGPHKLDEAWPGLRQGIQRQIPESPEQIGLDSHPA